MPAKWPYQLPYARLNLRVHPELYRIGIGEQGVLSVQPYKREILPHWRFATPETAELSSSKLRSLFEEYRDAGDFVGCDMTRKFIQMGVTRARRYANHKGGRKYEKQTAEEKATKKKVQRPKDEEDPIKAESARIFGVVLAEVKEDAQYKRMTAEHKAKFEKAELPDDLEPYLLPEGELEDVKKEEEMK